MQTQPQYSERPGPPERQSTPPLRIIRLVGLCDVNSILDARWLGLAQRTGRVLGLVGRVVLDVQNLWQPEH